MNLHRHHESQSNEGGPNAHWVGSPPISPKVKMQSTRYQNIELLFLDVLDLSLETP